MYHSVSASAQPSRYTVSAAEFEKQMHSLRDSGYRVLSLAETLIKLEEPESSQRNFVCLTFDDGFRGAYQFAAPILRIFDYPAIFFLVSGLMGTSNRWDEGQNANGELRLMSWTEAKELLDAGFDIGSHTVNHLILPEISKARATEEIRRCKLDVEAKLGIAVQYFAYPYGRFSGPIRDLVCEAGYAAACSTLSGFANRDNDRFALRRIEIFGSDSLNVFNRKVKFGANEMSSGEVFRYYVKRTIARFVPPAG